MCIYTIKKKPPSVLKRLEMCQTGAVVMSAVTFAELMNGAKKSRWVDDNVRRLNALSELIEVLAFDRDAAVVYGDVRSDLEKRGLVIGGNDLFIAAHALSLGYPLVTNNQREFSRVKGLMIDNWLE
ncbi:PIN domain-containing protein [Desulfosarcina ovata]|uniref:PIN domain-containing protein n=1 Tax=Desulfosarcina ovata TaxID=83564 RepID=UPI0012D2D3FD